MRTRRLHIALWMVLIGLGMVPAMGATQASVSGVVRDSSGEPQIGAVVQLLRPDLSVLASVYTNGKGHFAFPSVAPGAYAVKAMGTSFLPSLRENVRVRTSTIVNLTLNTLYEVMQWLPAEARTANTPKDDWAWTLRSAANRPLLRWLEDGPLVVVSEGPKSTPKLKARLTAVGQEGTFGEDGRRLTMEVENTPSNSRELLASVDFAPGTDGRMESMLGFRQDLGFAGSVQSVAAVSLHPEIEGGAAQGLDEAAIRTWQTMSMGDEFEVETGAEQVLARFGEGDGDTVLASLPFVSAGWHSGDSTVRFAFATAIPSAPDSGSSSAEAYLPAMSMRDGHLALEHGTHQAIGWERWTDNSGLSVTLYADTLSNPVLEAMIRTPGTSSGYGGNALYDRTSNMLRAAGPGFSSAGVVAAAERHDKQGDSVRLTYANGNALAFAGARRPMNLGQLAMTARPRRTQMYALALSGTIEGSGTRWRASYRWQPEDTVTAVAGYASDGTEPYLSLHLRQPVCLHREGARGLDAMLDMRNVLGQGGRSFVLTDGSLLVFAQNRPSVSAGLAFTF